MAVPTRVYVGVVVFGVIAALVTLTYTALVLSGVRQPPDPSEPYQVLFPPEGSSIPVGEQVFLGIASLFSVAVTVWAWRTLVSGARADAAMRRSRAEDAKRQRDRSR